MVGLDDLRGLFQTSWFYGSMNEQPMGWRGGWGLSMSPAGQGVDGQTMQTVARGMGRGVLHPSFLEGIK